MPKIDEKLVSDLMTAIDQKNIAQVDQLVLTSDILPSYETFAHTLRKVPSDALRDQYLNELKALLTTPAPSIIN